MAKKPKKPLRQTRPIVRPILTNLVPPKPETFPDDDRPESSPYTGATVSLIFGKGATEYKVSKALVPQSMVSKGEYSCYGHPKYNLPTIDKDIAHTLVHYLNTGAYQTLRMTDTNLSERALKVYVAAKAHGLDRLAVLAREKICSLNSIPLEDVLNHVEAAFSKLSVDDGWLTGKLQEALKSALSPDGANLKASDFCHINSQFARAVLRGIMTIFPGMVTDSIQRRSGHEEERYQLAPVPGECNAKTQSTYSLESSTSRALSHDMSYANSIMSTYSGIFSGEVENKNTPYDGEKERSNAPPAGVTGGFCEDETCKDLNDLFVHDGPENPEGCRYGAPAEDCSDKSEVEETRNSPTSPVLAESIAPNPFSEQEPAILLPEIPEPRSEATCNPIDSLPVDPKHHCSTSSKLSKSEKKGKSGVCCGYETDALSDHPYESGSTAMKDRHSSSGPDSQATSAKKQDAGSLPSVAPLGRHPPSQNSLSSRVNEMVSGWACHMTEEYLAGHGWKHCDMCRPVILRMAQKAYGWLDEK